MQLEVKELVFSEVGDSEKLSLELFKEEVDSEILAERIKGDIEILRLEEDLLAKFTGIAKVALVCDRCLESFKMEVPLNFSQIYKIGRGPKEEEELRVEKGFTIDVREPVRQEILITLPAKILCDRDCLGICKNCGVNLNEKECNCK